MYKCTVCTLVSSPPRYDDLRGYYADKYRQTHNNAVGKVLTPREDFDLMRPLQDRREMFFREYIPPGAKVLEVGASSGFFLDRIRKDYAVYSNEWNPDFASFTRDELRIPTDESALEDAFPGEQFTVICAYHVVEHQPDPVEWIKLLKSRLIGGGWLILEAPNLDSALNSVFRIPEFHDFFFRESHLSYFTAETLAQVVATQGFEARVYYRQDYSLMNALHWLYLRGPQEDAQQGRMPLSFVPLDHPAAATVNRLFARFDREYRNMLDILKACDTLSLIGRKREI